MIIREGFRAIVEKAFLLNAVSEEDVKKARPHPLLHTDFIPLDQDALADQGAEIYPIVHDLAWYVINRAFDDFLEYSTVSDPDTDEAGLSETDFFLKAWLTDDVHRLIQATGPFLLRFFT